MSDDSDADDGGIVICVHCRVTDRSEDLFYGNMAPGISNPLTENQQTFCRCDRPHGSDPDAVNTTAVCDRRVVSDNSEPQRNVQLEVPRDIVEKRRRRKRQTPGRGVNALDQQSADLPN